MAQIYLHKHIAGVRSKSRQRYTTDESEDSQIVHPKACWAGPYSDCLYGLPPHDHRSARIYAKFWEINAEVYRPSILAVLTSSDHSKRECGKLGYTESALLHRAKKGIEAIFNSAAAFHGVTGRKLITTDLAHRHCVHIITLVSLRRDLILRNFVYWESLQRVLEGGCQMLVEEPEYLHSVGPIFSSLECFVDLELQAQ